MNIQNKSVYIKTVKVLISSLLMVVLKTNKIPFLLLIRIQLLFLYQFLKWYY